MSKITGPLFKWFGSKWSAARLYPASTHSSIYEPYAGSAGYSLRHSDHNITLWDSNPRLQELWSWLIYSATENDVRSIPLDITEGTDIRQLGLSWGQQLLLKHWQRTNNYGECWTISPWGNKPGQWTANTRARVAEEISAIKHWQFGPIDWNAIGTYFIDPPYQYNYTYGVKNFDYTELVQKCKDLPITSEIIACEAVCSKTGAVPSYLPFSFFANRVTSRRKVENNHHSKELLWVGSSLELQNV